MDARDWMAQALGKQEIAMPMILRAASRYFALVFVVAFALGVVRTLLLAPRMGPFRAVAIEVPIILAVSWVVAGWVLRRLPLPSPGARLAMGAVAFAFLMVAELALTVALGGTPCGFVAGMASAAGALGLAGQIGFAIVPALRRSA
jgi:hypothetical protein